MSESDSDGSSEQQHNKDPSPPKNISALLPPSQINVNGRITINVSMTHYDIIEDVAIEMDWKIQYKQAAGNWDVLWIDSILPPQLLIKMQLYQKISHMPGIHILARKNLLGQSLMDMQNRAPQEYNFFPKTWLLPSQYGQFRHQITQKKGTFIAKPEANCQGKGIFLTQKIEDIQNGKHYVIQQYIERPFLVEGLKFDFRVYVLMCGVSPMRLYIYEQGLARFATEKYEEPCKENLKKQCMHLTNYAINKKNPKFQFNTSIHNMHRGHKRSLTSVYKLMQTKGINIKNLKQRINDTIVKTFIVGHPLVNHQYRFCQPEDQHRNMCFHLLGIDIMIDQDCRPVLLEVNHTPSFVADTPLDYHIKFGLIRDTVVLMNICKSTRKEALRRINQNYKNNLYNKVGSKRQMYENAEKQEKVKKAQQFRDQYQSKNCGKFTKIFPCTDQQRMQTYNQLLQKAEKSFFSDNNVLRAQIDKQKQQDEEKSPIKKPQQQPQQLKTIKMPRKIYSLTQKLNGEFQKNLEESKEELLMKNKILKRQRVGSFKEAKFQAKAEIKLDKSQLFKKSNLNVNRIQLDFRNSQQKHKDGLKGMQEELMYPPDQSYSELLMYSPSKHKFQNPLVPNLKPIAKILPKIESETPSPSKSLPGSQTLELKQQSQYINYRKKKIVSLRQKQKQEQINNNRYKIRMASSKLFGGMEMINFIKPINGVIRYGHSTNRWK